jgi:hypothetical protein
MFRSGLAERETVGPSAGVGEGDLEGALGDGAALAEELIHPLLGEGAVAVGVGVGPVRLAGWLSVDTDADQTAVPGAAGPMTRLRSRAWKRQAICPFAAFSVVASSAMVQSPDTAHWLSPSSAGTV